MLTEKQLKERRNYIGGSDVGAILRLNPYRTPLDIYAEKVEGTVLDLSENLAVQRGNKLEEFVRQEFQEMTGANVNIPANTVYHKKHPFLAANIDGLLPDGTILEIKCVSEHAWRHGWTQNTMPPHYLCQCAHYASVYEAPKVILAAFHGITSPLAIYTYERDTRLEKIIEVQLLRFWRNHILKRVPPEPMCLDEIRSVYEESTRESIVATEEISSLSIHLRKALQQQRILKVQIEGMKAEIAKYMQDKEILYDNDGEKLATWHKTAKNSRVLRIIGDRNENK